VPAEASAIRNAMTVDVEDYFQVSAFDAVVARDAWPSFESRVEANTEGLMAISTRQGCAPRSSSWVGRRASPLAGAANQRSGPRGGFARAWASSGVRPGTGRVPR